MFSAGGRPSPRPGQLWLGRPPYLFVARVLAVERARGEQLVSYELHDEDGAVLDQVHHASVDEGWWRAFQPLVPRYG
jgi:hypothetical protein